MPEIPRALVASIVAFACFVLLLVLATSAFQDVLPLSPWYWLVQVALLGSSVIFLLAWRLDVSIRDSIAIAVATSGVLEEEEDETDAPIEAMALDVSLKQRATQPTHARPATVAATTATRPDRPAPAAAVGTTRSTTPRSGPAPAPAASPAPVTTAKPVTPAPSTPPSSPAFAPAGPPATPEGPRRAFKVSWKTVSLFIETYKEAGIGAFSLSKIRKDMGIDADDEKKIAKLKEMLVRASMNDVIVKKGNKHVITRA